MRMFAPLIVASCLLVGAARSAAQKEGQPSQEASSAPGLGQKLLEKMAGFWEVSKVYYPREGDPVRTSGQCRSTMIQDGRFLQTEFVFDQAEGKFTGLGIIGFEPETGRFTSFWVDSRQTRASVRQGREPFDGQKIVLYSVCARPPEQRIPPFQDHLSTRRRRPQARPPPVRPGQRQRGTPGHGAHHDPEKSSPPIQNEPPVLPSLKNP